MAGNTRDAGPGWGEGAEGLGRALEKAWGLRPRLGRGWRALSGVLLVIGHLALTVPEAIGHCLTAGSRRAVCPPQREWGAWPCGSPFPKVGRGLQWQQGSVLRSPFLPACVAQLCSSAAAVVSPRLQQ